MRTLHKKIGLLLIPAGLCLLTIATYFRSLSYGFMFDDMPTIEQNILLRIQSFRSMFLHNQRWLSTWFNKWTFVTWGADPYVFRLQALMLHILLGLLLFLLFYKLLSTSRKEHSRTNSLLLAALTSGLFLLHPAQSLTAAYIAQMRQEGLVLLCILLSCISLFYATKSTSQLKRYFFYSLIIFITSLGCGTKEIIIVLPILLLITDWFFLAQGNRSEFIGRLPLYIACAATIIGLYLYMKQSALLTSVATARYTVSNNRGNMLTPQADQTINPFAYATSQLQVIIHYITIFIAPLWLCFDYSYKILDSFFDYRVLTPLSILLALFLFMGTRLRANSSDPVSFCLLWFFIAILPRASIVPSMEFTCDYRTYIASPGMMLLIALGLTKLLEYIQTRKGIPLVFHKYGTVAFFTLLAVPLCLKTREQTVIWRSLLDMWGDVVEKNPTKPRAWNNYAVGLSHRHRFDEAIAAFNKAIECDPTYAEPVINLAYHYQQQGDDAKAMELYKKAINMKEVHPEMYNNVGYLHLSEKRYYNAEESFKVALHLKPHYTLARVGLAQTYSAQNKFEEAEALLKQGIEIDPTNLELIYVYGTLLSGQKKYAQACDILLKSDTTYKDTHFVIGSCFYNQGNYTQASHHFLAAYNANPHSWNHAYNLAMSYLNTAQFAKAAPLFEQCMPHKEKPPFTLMHLLRCYKETGKVEQAQQIISQMVASNLPQSIIDEAKKILS